MNKKDMAFRNLATLQERAKNLNFLMMRMEGDFEQLSEMLVIIYSMKMNLTVIEEIIQETKQWKSTGDTNVPEA